MNPQVHIVETKIPELFHKLCAIICVVGVASAVRTSMQESLVQILSPKKRVDILRDAMEAKRKGKPYTIVFCGVNGVGKSTNLSKV